MSKVKKTQPHMSADKVWKEYEAGVTFKQQLDLYQTVKVNEDFYVGRQWEGVQSNGLPTPVFNYIKRIVLYLVASTAADNIKLNASVLEAAGHDRNQSERLAQVVNIQFESLFEHNKMAQLLRRFMRNAAVDGDACLYAWFDPDVETGQPMKGAIRTEILENTRVIFGNPNTAEVQGQPYIIISRRERLEDVRREMRAQGGDPELVRADSDEAGDRFDALSDGKVTTLTRLWKMDGTVWCVKTVQGAVVRPAWNTEQKRYPLVWMSWDRVSNCYHGQAAVTGLIPNQIFVNKMFAMTMISLMTTAYPKVIYDKTRIARWDSGVGKAIGVELGSGSIGDVAKTVDPAVISPQVSQFIELAVSMTKEFMGATDAALGNVRPDNTSAIVALQKASQVPMELTRQDLYQCMEDLGKVWMDLMRVYYGQRSVELPMSTQEQSVLQRLAAFGGPGAAKVVQSFDFAALEDTVLSLKLDVGGSAYWSEIAQINTLDNLLSQGKISVVDYLERIPSGFISDQQELIETLKKREQGLPEQAVLPEVSNV